MYYSASLDEATQPRQALLNDLMLDMIANTGCSWEAATAAVAYWEYHYAKKTAPVYGVVDYGDEKANVVFDCGKKKHSIKIGYLIGKGHEVMWALTIQ